MRVTSVPRLKVGIISQWFSPEPVPIPRSIAQGLADRGHSVRVLTGFPNYPTGQIYNGYDDSGPTEETMAGALLMRIPAFLSHDLNAGHRLRSFLSFGARSLRGAAFLRHSDVNYVYATPMTAAACALACRLLWKTPYVLHVQDLWPESITGSGMVPDGRRKSLIAALTNFALGPVYTLAKHIVVISPGMKRALVQRDVDANKISIIYNWDANEYRPRTGYSLPSRIRNSPTLHCVYAGNIGQMQDVETIVRAAAEVEFEVDLRISVYGSGVAEESLAGLIRELGVKNVQLCGRVTPDQMQAIYDVSDFQFVTLRDLPVFRMTIPSKFQASLANGVPIITTVQGDLAAMCVDNKLGFVAQPENIGDLANALRKAANMDRAEHLAMSQRAREFYRTDLAVEVGLERICKVVAEAAQVKAKANELGRP